MLITPADLMSCLREMLETFCFQALSETIYSRSSDRIDCHLDFFIAAMIQLM